MTSGPWRHRPGEPGATEAALSRFREELERLYDRFTGEQWGTSPLESWPARLGWGPRMDLVESESAITIMAELPGVDPENVDIQISDNVLTIRGEKSRDEESAAPNHPHYSERQFGPFQRSVQLPATVDPNHVNAQCRQGVLKISLQKKSDAQPRRVVVSID